MDGRPGPAVIDRVHQLLADRIPDQQGEVIVHGDYRLDNTVLDDDGNVAAILDWEICTLGDPLADVGLLMVYWTEPEDGSEALLGVAPTTLPGFARRSELLDRYAAIHREGPLGDRLLPGLRILEAGLHPPGRLGPLRRRCGRRRPLRCRPVRRQRRSAGRAGTGGGGVPVSDRDPSSIYLIDPQWGEPVDRRLSRPVLVIGLEGWVDAGMGASAAIAELLASSATTPVASFDTEVLIDQRARRPIARLEDGVTTELTWPSIQVVAGTDRVGADIVYLTGPEPDFRWPTFIDAVVGLAQALQVRHRGGSGRVSGPHAPHPAGPVGLDRPSPVGGAGRTGGHGARHPRGARRRAGRARGLVRRRRDPGDRAMGPCPPLRVGHALPRGQRGADRGALCGDRNRPRQLGPAQRRRGGSPSG